MMKNKKGFSFLEIIIATFLSVLLMTATAMAFSRLYGSYQRARSMIKNLENAQYAMNTMAKTIRTSNIASSSSHAIKFYSYSEGGKCISYELSGDNRIRGASENNPGDSYPDKVAWCRDTVSFASGEYDYLTESFVNDLQFAVTPSNALSNPKIVGKVIMLMDICSAASCSGTSNERIKIETSVSLRGYSGLFQ